MWALQQAQGQALHKEGTYMTITANLGVRGYHCHPFKVEETEV